LLSLVFSRTFLCFHVQFYPFPCRPNSYQIIFIPHNFPLKIRKLSRELLNFKTKTIQLPLPNRIINIGQDAQWNVNKQRICKFSTTDCFFGNIWLWVLCLYHIGLDTSVLIILDITSIPHSIWSCHLNVVLIGDISIPKTHQWRLISPHRYTDRSKQCHFLKCIFKGIYNNGKQTNVGYHVMRNKLIMYLFYVPI
jgi:hypothetical protein